MMGHCSIQFVVEGDGGVYPCDFYVLDELRLGTVGVDRFEGMAHCPTAQQFLQSSLSVPEECRQCPYYALCRNGCRRDRIVSSEGIPVQSYYCPALKHFFSCRLAQLQQAAAILAHWL